jgi:hypothetical protein
LSTEVDPSKTRPADSELTVIVFAPREPDPKTFELRRTETVRDSARTAADAFGYEGGNPSFETEHHVVLDRDKTLAEAGVQDGERLHLVDVGGGV